MSNSSQYNIDDFISQSILIGNEIDTAGSVFYIYDYVLTLFQEYDHIWARRWTLTTWVFAANRYIVLAIAILWRVPLTNNAGCIGGIRLVEALSTIQLLVLASFTALRTSVLCNRSICTFLVVFTLLCVPFFVDLVLHIKSPESFLAAPNPAWDVCDETIPFSEATTFKCKRQINAPVMTVLRALGMIVTLTSRIAVVVGETIALIVSWRKAMVTVREAIRHDLKVSLSRAIIQNGTILFFVLVVLNIYQVLTYTVPALFNLYAGDPFIDTLPAALTNRFILNLKQAADQPDQESTVDKSTVRFNSDRLIGNMGESLDLDGENDLETSLEEQTDSTEAHSHSGIEGSQSTEPTETPA